MEESLGRMWNLGSTTRNLQVVTEIAKRVEKIRTEEESEFNRGQIKALQSLFDFLK